MDSGPSFPYLCVGLQLGLQLCIGTYLFACVQLAISLCLCMALLNFVDCVVLSGLLLWHKGDLCPNFP